jgi:hypothetical protein
LRQDALFCEVAKAAPTLCFREQPDMEESAQSALNAKNGRENASPVTSQAGVFMWYVHHNLSLKFQCGEEND